MTTIKLHEIRTPAVEVEVVPGDVRTYDPFEVARRIEPLLKDGMTLEATIGVLRQVLGLGPDLASDYRVLHLHKVLIDFVGEQIRSKGVPPVPPS